MDTKKEFNEVLIDAFARKGIIFRKNGEYLYDTAMTELELQENLTHKGHDYFTLFTKDGQLVEYVLLGKITIDDIDDIDAHKAARKYTSYKTEMEENFHFRSAINMALKHNENVIFKNSKDGYSIGKQNTSILNDILSSHYFIYIIDREIYEFYRFDIRNVMNGKMDLPRL